jgi:hypothetical protein
MKTRLFYIMISALIFACMASGAYDIVAVDTGNSEITRMDVDGNIVWQAPLGSSYVDAVVGPDGNIFVADNTNRRVTVVAASSGDRSTFFSDGSRCISLDFGPDYNSDGVNDLYVSGEGRIVVVGGPGNGNEGSVLATNSTLTAGNSVSVTFGPDETSDGQEELYVIDGDANLISVVDGMDVSSVLRSFAVNISLLKGGVIKNGKIYYSDANTSFRNFIAQYNTDGSGAPDVTKIIQHPAVNYAQYFEFGPDGKCYMPNRFNTGTRTNPSVDVFDSSFNYLETIYEKAGANFTAVAIIPVDDGFKDFFVVDGSINNKLYKFNYLGELMWEADGFRSTRVMTMGPDDMIYCFRQGVDNTIEKVNPVNGSMTRFFTPDQSNGTNRAYGGTFAYDYNQDGVVDLYALTGNVTSTWTTECVITGYSTLNVISGPGAVDAGSVLATVDNLIATAITTGPDVATIASASEPNSPDGIDELYLCRGDNGSTKPHAMYVIEPSTLRIAKAYTAQRTAAGVPTAEENPAFSITGDNEMLFGTDGYLYVNSHYNDRISRFEVSLTAGSIAIAQSGPYLFADSTKANNPGGFDFYNGSIYIANRFALRSDTVTSDVYPGEVSIVNLSDTALEGVFAAIPDSGRGDDILIVDAFECPFNYPADLNGDCWLDGADIAIIAADWLACTDPVISNCP